MRRNRTRTLSILLLLALLFSLLPGLQPKASAEAKNIGVGVEYAEGDTVVIPNDETWILKDDNPTEKKELDAGSYPVLEVTKNNPTYSQGKIQLQGEAFFGTYPIEIFVTKPEDKKADDPIGFRIKGGDGSEDNPYTFEFVYATTAPTTFTVSFNNGGGAGGKDPVTGVSGEYELPANPFSYPGYDFAGWQIGDDASNVQQPGAKINVTANVTLTARWTLKDLTFHVGSGTATFGTQSGTDLTGLHINDVVNITADAAPSGQQFVEWRVTDGNGSFGSQTAATTSYTMGTNNVTIFAYYENVVQTCVHEEGDTTVTLTAWSGSTPLPNTAGNYCLTADVTLSTTWVAPPGVTRLCLYNHNITMSGSGPAISVPSGATLILYSHSATMDATTNVISSAGGSGIEVSGGSLTTRGVKLYNNGSSGLVVNSGSATVTDWTYIRFNGSSTTNGGGIAVNGGSCLVDSGIISDNSALAGGAVYIGGGTLSLAYGPTLSGNNATFGDSVCVADGTFNLAGSPTLGGVYLASGKLITVTGTLSSTGISITMQDGSGVFTSGLSGKGGSANFSSADANYFVTTTAEGEAQIGAAHVHDWSYTLNASNAGVAFVNASCTTGCDITSGLSLGLYAPANLTYSGNPKSATLSTGYSTVAFPGTYTISYAGANSTVYGPTSDAPTYPGDYTASVVVEGVTASVSFTITGTVPQHTVTVTADPAAGGTVSVSAPTWDENTSKVNEGDTVTVSAVAGAGYQLDTITVTETTSGDQVAVNGNTFVMPAGDVSVSARFIGNNTPVLNSVNLTDGGRIGVTFKLTLPVGLEASTVTAELTVGGTTTSTVLSTLEPSNGVYSVSTWLPARQMDTPITLRTRVGEVYKMQGSTGSDLSAGYETSISACCDIYANDPDAELAALATAMKTYGAYAHAYLDGAALAANTPELNVNESAFNAFSITKPTELPAGLTLKSMFLTLDNDTAINLRFTIAEGHSFEEYANIDGLFMNGSTVLNPVQDGNTLVITIPGIAAPRLNDVYTVKVQGSDTNVIACSALYYGTLAMGTNKDALKNAVKALYAYNQAAEAYFGA